MKKWIVMAVAVLGLAACNHLEMGHPPSSTAETAPVYIVFFHFDSTVLTPVGQQIIAQAAKSALATKPRKIEIAGYTEASAPPATKKFAEPRFKAVEAALVADGVDPGLLSRAPLADQEAALPSTGDRRVEIRLIDRTQHP